MSLSGSGSFTTVKGGHDHKESQSPTFGAPRTWDDPTTVLYVPKPGGSQEYQSRDTAASSGASPAHKAAAALHHADRVSPLGHVAVKKAVERRASTTGQMTPELMARNSPTAADAQGRRGSVSEMVLNAHQQQKRNSLTGAMGGLSISGTGVSNSSKEATNTHRRGSVTGVVSATVATVENGHLHVRKEEAFAGVSLTRKEIPDLEKVVQGFGSVQGASLEGRKLMKVCYRACMPKAAGELIQVLNAVFCLPPENRSYEVFRDAVDSSKNPATRCLRQSFEKFVDTVLDGKEGYRLPAIIHAMKPHIVHREDIFAPGRTDCLGCQWCRDT